MNGRMAVVATIVSWLTRGASPVDGIYWVDTREMRKSDAKARTCTGSVPAAGEYAHCG